MAESIIKGITKYKNEILTTFYTNMVDFHQ